MCVRERNSDRLFKVENADCPPSLSKHGMLRSDQKSDLLSCLEVECPSDFEEADAKLIDGAHMVHLFRRDASIESFHDYADKTVIPLSRGSWPTLKELMSSGTAIYQTV